MVYHSTFKNTDNIRHVCGCPLLPVKGHMKGPAPEGDQGKIDIIDEAIVFFRANVFFRKYEVKGSADKLLIYLTLFINTALKRIENCRTIAEGTKAIINLGLEDFPIPGEPGFQLESLFTAPASEDEGELIRSYWQQLREETMGRLMDRAYHMNGMQNKWWVAFSKRRFMNMSIE